MLTSHIWSALQNQARNYVDAMGQDVLWLPRVTPTTPGATATPAWDTIRNEVVAYSDGSYGVGWQAPDPLANDPTALHMGYLPPRRIRVIIQHVPSNTPWGEGGYTPYEQPLAHFLPTYTTAQGDRMGTPQKGDVLALIVNQLETGPRYVVGDRASPQSIAGTVMIESAVLETRAESDVIWTIPLPVPTTV